MQRVRLLKVCKENFASSAEFLCFKFFLRFHRFLIVPTVFGEADRIPRNPQVKLSITLTTRLKLNSFHGEEFPPTKQTSTKSNIIYQRLLFSPPTTSTASIESTSNVYIALFFYFILRRLSWFAQGQRVDFGF
jgi:hypothetical protein